MISHPQFRFNEHVLQFSATHIFGRAGRRILRRIIRRRRFACAISIRNEVGRILQCDSLAFGRIVAELEAVSHDLVRAAVAHGEVLVHPQRIVLDGVAAGSVDGDGILAVFGDDDLGVELHLALLADPVLVHEVVPIDLLKGVGAPARIGHVDAARGVRAVGLERQRHGRGQRRTGIVQATVLAFERRAAVLNAGAAKARGSGGLGLAGGGIDGLAVPGAFGDFGLEEARRGLLDVSCGVCICCARCMACRRRCAWCASSTRMRSNRNARKRIWDNETIGVSKI